MYEKNTFRPNSFKKTDFRLKNYCNKPTNIKTVGVNDDYINNIIKIDSSNRGRFIERKRRSSVVDCNSDYRGFSKEEFDADYQQSNYKAGLPEGEFHMDSFLDFQLS